MILIDTNILVYAVSPGEPEKQARSREVLAELMRTGRAALSLQNCSEFLTAASLKPGSPISLDDAHAQLRAWRNHITILLPNMDTLDLATDGVKGHKLSFWDAMVWAVAEQHGVEEILTEDGPVGSTIGHVRFTNPFSI